MILNNRNCRYNNIIFSNIFLGFLSLLLIFYNTVFCDEGLTGNPFISGAILDAGFSNPSYTSLSNTPSFGIRLPFPLTTTLSLSNNKFSVNDPTEFLYLNGNYSAWISGILQNSFELDGLTPKEVSNKLTEELKDGMDLAVSFDGDYLKIAKSFYRKDVYEGVRIGIKSNTSAELHIPGDAFSLLFSYQDGLQKGNVIDFSSLQGYFQFSTDLFVAYGREMRPVLKIGENSFKFALGGAVAYRMGHLMMLADMQDGYLIYNEDNVLNLHSNLKIKSAGIKFDENLNINVGSGLSEYVNGHGFNFSGDFSFYSKKLLLSLGISNIGLIYWNDNLYSLKASFSKDSLTLLGIMEEGIEDSIITHGEFDGVYKHYSKGTFDFCVSFYSDKKNSHFPVDLKKLSNARAIKFGYRQPIIGGVLKDYTPDFSLIAENEFFNGIMPVKIGWTFKTNGESTSFFQLRQVVTKGLSFTVAYCAREDPFFRWNKGCEIAISSNVYFD